jgi:hypothetical protein
MKHTNVYISPEQKEERRRIRNSVNALRHGLTTVRRSNPIFAPEITAIAESMCHASDQFLYDKAMLVAECDVTIAEIRRYKHYLIARMQDPDCLPTTKGNMEFRKRYAKVRQMLKISDNLSKFPASRSDPAFGDFAFHMTEMWGSPGGIELALVRALPDIEKVTRYEMKIWSLRRRRFREFLAARFSYQLNQSSISR